MARGRPVGSTNKSSIPNALVKEWAIIYNEGDDEEKAFVIKRLDHYNLEQEATIARLAEVYAKIKKQPDFRQANEAEIMKILVSISQAVKNSLNFVKLVELIPQYNLIVRLDTLEIDKIKRPVPRKKKDG